MQNTSDSLRDLGSRIRTACGWIFDFVFEYFVEDVLTFGRTAVPEVITSVAYSTIKPNVLDAKWSPISTYRIF